MDCFCLVKRVCTTALDFNAGGRCAKCACGADSIMNLIERLPRLEGREQETDKTVWRSPLKFLRVRHYVIRPNSRGSCAHPLSLILLTLRMSDVFFVFAPSFCWTMFTFRQQVHSDTQSESRRVRSRLSAIFLLWAPVEIFPCGRHPQLHRSH